jgi:hypothetical protein
MNYNEYKEINELIKNFNRIRKKKYIKSINNGISGMGLTFEKELGIEKNDFNGPDFKGIELKTHLAYSKSPIGLFTLAPSNDSYELKRLVETYGTDNIYGGKSFNAVLSCGRKIYKSNGYSFKLEYKKSENKITLNIYKGDKLIDDTIYWDYYTIWSIIIQKLNCLALINTWPNTRKGDNYFWYYKLNVYYLKLKIQYYNLFLNDIIKIKINIGSYTKGKKLGKVHDHGCLFIINKENFPRLFNKVF